MNIMYMWFCPLSILLEEHIGIAFENDFVLDGVKMLYTAAHG